jgi:hypothetical protein
MTHPVVANAVSRSMDMAYRQGAHAMLEACREIVQIHLTNIDMGMPAVGFSQSLMRSFPIAG